MDFLLLLSFFFYTSIITLFQSHDSSFDGNCVTRKISNIFSTVLSMFVFFSIQPFLLFLLLVLLRLFSRVFLVKCLQVDSNSCSTQSFLLLLNKCSALLAHSQERKQKEWRSLRYHCRRQFKVMHPRLNNNKKKRIDSNE